VYRDRPRTLNELKTAYIRNISQANLQKVFANKIKRVQTYIDARGNHFQLSEHTVQLCMHGTKNIKLYETCKDTLSTDVDFGRCHGATSRCT
jgi:hypothetical protein